MRLTILLFTILSSSISALAAEEVENTVAKILEKSTICETVRNQEKSTTLRCDVSDQTAVISETQLVVNGLVSRTGYALKNCETLANYRICYFQK